MSFLFSKSEYKNALGKIHQEFNKSKYIDSDDIVIEEKQEANTLIDDTITALCVLGYNKRDATKYTKSGIKNGLSTSQDIITYALKEAKLKKNQ